MGGGDKITKKQNKGGREYAHLNFLDFKHELRANSLNGTTAALLEAKLQAISNGISSGQNKKHNSINSTDPSSISTSTATSTVNAITSDTKVIKK